MLYNQDNYTRILVTVGIVIFCLLFLISGVDFNNISLTEVFRSISSATLLTLFFHIAFKKWIWKYHWIPLLNPVIVLVPNLHGTWKGKLQSNWIDSETGEQVPPIEITAYIRQSFISISVEIHTSKMVSKSYIAGIKTDGDTETQELCYSYNSKANADSIETNPWHEGTAKLEIHSGSNPKLKGNYWTLRKTIGTIELQRINKNVMR
ncbi:hypothetical protein [Paenibacillus sp. FSL R5-808]|jgi:hypothetical protein|uniref:Cap15 family cyclic dinucleotide receptor domain-containing protein n=1 Tax=Paenibacillus sp. FSL R5-808 TaxID=1227076 RepID=UPI0003E1F1D7|nr:hypothetical protein [Paenibacillus sp. FSL R5-808]ETT38511.1 hypothetical protein C169_12902 [Paenibacillus sp. FSL R5-808]